MKITTRHIIYLTACITGCFFLYGCKNDRRVIDQLYSRKVGVEEARKVKIDFSSSGRPKAVLTSPLMLRVQDTVPYLEFPNTLKVMFYNEAGVHESTLTAMYARYKENEDVVFLRDSVRIWNIKGDTLYCKEMYWDRRRTGKEFYTDKPVRIRTKTHIIDGVGMEARQDFKNYTIIHPTGILKVPGGQAGM
ncbi:MAG: LPS export ABC transporter periplasmic protein LptC [Ferruginibacter sp.]